jgi:hypothetical protein
LFVVVLCTLCCQFLCVVFCLSSYCVPYVASFSVLCFACLRIVYPMSPVSLCCVLFVVVLCTLCCQFLCVVCCLSSYCVPYVASFSGLSFRYSLTFIYILTGSSFWAVGLLLAQKKKIKNGHLALRMLRSLCVEEN